MSAIIVGSKSFPRVLSDSGVSAPKSVSQYRVFVPANFSVIYYVVWAQVT